MLKSRPAISAQAKLVLAPLLKYPPGGVPPPAIETCPWSVMPYSQFRAMPTPPPTNGVMPYQVPRSAYTLTNPTAEEVLAR